ncbi:MAG TPA: hypothetical protein VK858_20310 [Longimicrobiales bacterium]|nr:hypothetical protein [Longimicrobiales bacterium]
MKRLRVVPSACLVPGLVLLGSLVPRDAAAQSLFSGYTFGTPIEVGDARAVALGSVGIGLGGTSYSPHDPAAAVHIAFPSVLFTSQTTWADVVRDGVTSDHTASRFPNIGIVYPIPRIGTVSASFTGVLDQNYQASEERTEILQESGTQIRVTDLFASDGGVSALRFGFARRLTPSISVGVNAGTYLGDLTRRFARTFDSIPVASEVPDYQVGGNWEYSGAHAAVGAAMEIPGVARIAGSVTWGGTLSADPSRTTVGAGVELDMPLEYRVGGTAILSERLFFNAGFHFGAFGDAASNLDGVEGATMRRYGAGLEWAGLSLLGKSSALRFGYRRGNMPFRVTGQGNITESIFGAGLGLELVQGPAGSILAESDFAFEWGNRDSSFLQEDFLRMSISLRISGF